MGSGSATCEESINKLIEDTGGAVCNRTDYEIRCMLKPCKSGYEYSYKPNYVYTCSNRTRMNFKPSDKPHCLGKYTHKRDKQRTISSVFFTIR